MAPDRRRPCAYLIGVPANPTSGFGEVLPRRPRRSDRAGAEVQSHLEVARSPAWHAPLRNVHGEELARLMMRSAHSVRCVSGRTCFFTPAVRGPGALAIVRRETSL